MGGILDLLIKSKLIFVHRHTQVFTADTISKLKANTLKLKFPFAAENDNGEGSGDCSGANESHLEAQDGQLDTGVGNFESDGDRHEVKQTL